MIYASHRHWFMLIFLFSFFFKESVNGTRPLLSGYDDVCWETAMNMSGYHTDKDRKIKIMVTVLMIICIAYSRALSEKYICNHIDIMCTKGKIPQAYT